MKKVITVHVLDRAVFTLASPLKVKAGTKDRILEGGLPPVTRASGERMVERARTFGTCYHSGGLLPMPLAPSRGRK